MKRIEIKMTDETYTSIVGVLGEGFTGKKIVEYILNNTTAGCDDNQLEEVTAKYEALKKTQTRLQDIVDGIDDIKKMLQQGTPKASVGGAKVIAGGGSVYNNDMLSNKETVSQEMFTYSKDDMVIISKTKEGIPYINNNLKNLWNEFKIQVSGYESDKINIEQFEAGCEKRQLSIFIPTYRNNKDLFNYLLSK